MLTDFVTTGSYISQYSNFSRDSGNVSKERILKKKKVVAGIALKCTLPGLSCLSISNTVLER